jgi:anaerobic magnesium-protoporphyrin IX monomethyl ester cyclase
VGLGYVAKSLETAGVEYEVVDLIIDPIDELVYRIREFCPEFMGISMMSYRCKGTYKLLHDVKHAFPKLKIIAGGPHVTANRERVLMECPAIDIGVVGEGEIAIVEIVRGNPLSTVKGALYREEQAVRFAGERDFIYNLDEIPFPTYRGFKLENYGKTMQLNSSRGCPYKCIFCGAPRILGKRWRKRSVQGMVEELKYWYERGYRNFYFSDSNFAVDKTRVWNFCEEVIKRNLDACFMADGLRADHVDRKLLEQMRRAGFTSLTFGVESGSNKVLRNLKKGETREQIESAIATATDLGFHVVLFFLIGSPGEDVEDIKQSFQLARKYDVAKIYFFNLTPISGTEFYDWAVEQGYIDEYEGRYPEANFAFSNEALFRTDVMTIGEMTWWIKRARRVERQIEWRHNLQEYLQRVTGKRIRTNSVFVNALSWYIVSYPALKVVLRPFWRMIKLVARAARWFCNPRHLRGKV